MAEINGYSEMIDNDDVDSRIEELEEKEGYEVVRVRNDAVLATYSDPDDARLYIEDEDYDPERVIVRAVELDEDDAVELRQLRKLRDDVAVSSSWTLYNESYFDEEWTKGEARDQLGLSGYVDFDSWPLSLIDWDDATSERRDVLYEYSYSFDGTTFYSAE